MSEVVIAEPSLEWGQIRFKLYGVRISKGRDALPARVFAAKLLTLVKALRAADRSINGRVRYEYDIARLREGSGIIDLRESPTRGWVKAASGIDAFDLCIRAIHEGDKIAAQRFGRCPALIANLADGAGESFAYGELLVNGHTHIRVDGFLREQSKAVWDVVSEYITAPQQKSWFKGFVFAEFDGKIVEVDIRGSLPQVKLFLHAGGKEIDCIVKDIPVDILGSVLDQRVRISGRAYYDGKSGLPRRVEVSDVHIVKKSSDFRRWAGSFQPFVAPDWHDES